MRHVLNSQISGIYDELTAAADGAGHASDSSEEKPLLATPSGSQSAPAPPSSLPRPLSKPKPKVKREDGPSRSKAEISDSDDGASGTGQDDEAFARQLQSEFNSYGARPSRASTSRPKAKKVVKKKKRSAATVDSGDEDGEPKKKRAAPNTAFNKDLILR